MNDSRRVLITGVTRGLGLAMMSKLVELGHRVVGCGRDRERLALHSSKYGAAVSLSVVDVSDWQAVDGWSKGVLREFGAPDLILNNAAIINENLPLWEVSAGDFSGIVDVNIKGVFHVIRAFAPAMI